MDNSAKLDSWNAVKKGVDSSETRQRVEIQRIYWTKIGQNIGNEVFGKGVTLCSPCFSYQRVLQRHLSRRAAFEQNCK